MSATATTPSVPVFSVEADGKKFESRDGGLTWTDEQEGVFLSHIDLGAAGNYSAFQSGKYKIPGQCDHGGMDLDELDFVLSAVTSYWKGQVSASVCDVSG